MWKNYLKIAIRNLIKNKIYSLINIGGLAIGFACCLTIGLFIWDEINFDKFHTNGKYIYRIFEKQKMMGGEYDLAVTPGPLGPAVKADFAEVVQSCRIGYPQSGILQYDSKVIESESIYFSEQSLFTLFDFELAKGDPKNVLIHPNEIIINENFADRLFGAGWRNEEDVIGKTLSLNDHSTFILKGIAKNPRSNSHIQFDVLIPCKIDELNSNSYHWDNHNYHTYIQLDPKADAASLEKKLFQYIKSKAPNTSSSLYLEPLHDIYLFSNFAFQTDWSKTSNILYVKIFSTVGIIVLLIALFNFINLTTARALQRAQEVGVRKAIGALRAQLVLQFLGEALLITLLAGVASLLVINIFLPLMNNIALKSIKVPYNNPYFTLSFLGLMILATLLGGLYPAFFLSRFQPSKVLKGVFSLGSGQFLRRSLVVGQFAFSVMLIIGSIAIYSQLTFIQNKSLGFDKSQLLVVKMKNELEKNPALVKADLRQQSSILSTASASTNIVDINSSTGAIDWEGKDPKDKFKMAQLNIDGDFLATTGIKLAAGRNFNVQFASDTTSAFLVNEAAAQRMGWTPEKAIDKQISIWGFKGKIIGVVKNFNFRPLTDAKVEPLLFRYWPRETYSQLFVKTSPDKVPEAIANIERIYKKYEKRATFQYEFVDQTLEKQYQAEKRTGRIVLYFCILAIFLSCLGLLGLAMFTAEQRRKEIGIRKVLGATVASITNLLAKDFLKLVLLAILIASPIAWYFMNQWLAEFAYRIDMQWWMFVVAGVAAVGIAFLTIGFQSVKAALANPVKSLKSE